MFSVADIVGVLIWAAVFFFPATVFVGVVLISAKKGGFIDKFFSNNFDIKLWFTAAIVGLLISLFVAYAAKTGSGVDMEPSRPGIGPLEY